MTPTPVSWNRRSSLKHPRYFQRLKLQPLNRWNMSGTRPELVYLVSYREASYKSRRQLQLSLDRSFFLFSRENWRLGRKHPYAAVWLTKAGRIFKCTAIQRNSYILGSAKSPTVQRGTTTTQYNLACRRPCALIKFDSRISVKASLGASIQIGLVISKR